MITIVPIIKNLSSTAGSLLDKHNTRDLFFSPSEPASPFPASSGPYCQQEGNQAHIPTIHQEGLYLSNNKVEHLPVNMAPSSSAPQSKPETCDTLQYGQDLPQNHIKAMLVYSHAPSQETTENQEEQPRQPGPMKAFKGMAAEQTPEQLSHMDSLERKDVKPFNRGKRGNRERSLLGIPQSISTSERPRSSSPPSISSLELSSPSHPRERTTRRMLLRGVQKRLSVFPGSNHPQTHSTPQPVQPAMALTDSGIDSPAAKADESDDDSSVPPTASPVEEGLEQDTVQCRLSTRDQTQLSGNVDLGMSSLSARKAQLTSLETGTRASSPALDYQQIMDNECSEEVGSKGHKRRADPQTVYAGQPKAGGSKKRTRSPEDTTKKFKVQDHRSNGKLLHRNTKGMLSNPLG